MSSTVWNGEIINTRRARLLTIGMVLSISLPFLASCSSADSTPTPVISGSQAPAPGSADGVHSVADTDYEQTALVVDTTQVELDQIALDPSSKASAAVQAIAKQSAETVGRQATVWRNKLVTDGNATTDEHHKPAVGSTQIAALKRLSGAAFDTAGPCHDVAERTGHRCSSHRTKRWRRQGNPHAGTREDRLRIGSERCPASHRE